MTTRKVYGAQKVTIEGSIIRPCANCGTASLPVYQRDMVFGTHEVLLTHKPKVCPRCGFERPPEERVIAKVKHPKQTAQATKSRSLESIIKRVRLKKRNWQELLKAVNVERKKIGLKPIERSRETVSRWLSDYFPK